MWYHFDDVGYMKYWTRIFRVLSNINRLKIIDLLSDKQARSVTDIANVLKISVKSTSKHLLMLDGLDVVEGVGHSGHVFYSIGSSIPLPMKKAIRLFVSRNL